MSYQVLARKYRPKQFDEIVGQETVLKSLLHALKSNRLHHAYLFSGTRGVGKTSLARLLAKCLNCEVGVTDKPCGKCHLCLSIAEGNMVDLIEIDAASRTKVEDTRELLDQVQYMPTQARYKIYLIDEVHMLSSHSFNALLKTLEEPPEHVKFLLATTDPQKLPVTILSRCLQYHLQPIKKQQLIAQLQLILEKEAIKFDNEALDYLAQAASGSLRDALSLLDQAINFGQGNVTSDDVVTMLGVVDHRIVFDLAKEIILKDTNQALALTERIIAQGKSVSRILDALATLWYAVSIYQLTETVLFEAFSIDRLAELAKQIMPELLQLYYQITLKAKPELALVPEPKMALDMAIMRMIAFDMKNQQDKHKKDLSSSTPELKQITQVPAAAIESIETKIAQETEVLVDSKVEVTTSDHNWHQLATQLKLKGMARQIALNSHCINIKNDTYYLESKVYSVTDNVKAKLKLQLSEHLKHDVDVVFIEAKDNIKKVLTKEVSAKDTTLSNEHKQHASEKKNLTPAEIEHNKQQALLTASYQQLKMDSTVEAIESEFATSFEQAYIKLTD
ncbi:DNA polymerase III subunit gamma/tau [Thiotrichales bacterium 19S3-7]|nr:DNA polymerase III subunit gamma/tau [Thiotrichales bacterium 19S3-7]MCF6802130.1 DNA polymerase III subunit gamma/tau [Thiotrichales bacterium 19S3-11]